MQLSKNFTLREMTRSQTATRKGIDNNPTGTHQSNLVLLCQNILEFYEQGKPSSGWVHCSYNNKEENRKQFLRAYKDNGKTKYEMYDEG